MAEHNVAVLNPQGQEVSARDFQEADSNYRHGDDEDLLGFETQEDFDDAWAIVEAASFAASNMAGAIEAWRNKIATAKPY
jgi:hypothetical protein